MRWGEIVSITPANAGRDLLPFLAGRPRHELEFLPAALKVIETPAPPAARLISLTICAFCVAALAWSVIGRVDIVANAPGTIIPFGQTKIVQPLATGVVEQVLVADGDHVEAGQAVIRLDAVAALATRDRDAADLVGVRLDVAGLRALRDALLHPGNPVAFSAPEGATSAAVAQEYATIAARRAEQQAKPGSLASRSPKRRSRRSRTSPPSASSAPNCRCSPASATCTTGSKRAGSRAASTC